MKLKKSLVELLQGKISTDDSEGLRRSIQFTNTLIKRFIPFEIRDVIEEVERNTIKYKKRAFLIMEMLFWG